LQDQGIDAEEIFRKAGIPLDAGFDGGGNHQNQQSSQTNTLSLGNDVEHLKKISGGSSIPVGEAESDAEECKESISNENEKKICESENNGPRFITGEETSDHLECKEADFDQSE
jgi:hypothetical protein